MTRIELQRDEYLSLVYNQNKFSIVARDSSDLQLYPQCEFIHYEPRHYVSPATMALAKSICEEMIQALPGNHVQEWSNP